MATLIKALVIKRNGRTLAYPTYELVECQDLEGIVSLSNGHTRFTALNKRAIPVVYEVEQTLMQVKGLCNQCCRSNSTGA